MNLRQQLTKEHSSANCKLIVAWVGNSQSRFDELFALFINDEYRVVQLAAWPVSYCVEAHPQLIRKHFSTLIKNLKTPGTHSAVRRNTIRLLQYVKIPAKYQGQVMDLCFSYILSPKEKAAVKAFSLTVLANLSKQFPEILPEIHTIIEQRWDDETPAFRSRAKKFLKQID